MSSFITITNLNGGINIKSDPAAIAEDGLQDCVGFDLTEEGVLNTSKGLAANGISTLLPSGAIAWIEIQYINATRYILATNATGLYANGVLVQSGFIGRFKSVSFLNNIYLTNGTSSIRFNGTACFQWGITAPTTVPTITAGTYLSTVIDDFEILTDWIAHAAGCTATAESFYKKEGNYALKMAVPAGNTGTSYKYELLDLSVFSNGQASVVEDYIRFWFYASYFPNLESFTIVFDVGNGNFTSDYFSYTIVAPTTEQGIQTLGMGKSVNTIAEETVSFPYIEPIYGDVESQGQGYTVTRRTTTITEKTNRTAISPTLLDQTLSYWRTSNLFLLKSNGWREIKIPKSLFVQTGDITKGWGDVVSVLLQAKATTSGAVNVCIDGLRLVGGSDLSGDYWFMYTWGRSDGSGNILHESSPSRDNSTKQFNIIGPISFDRHPLTYSARPLSTDPQVDCSVLYGLGGGLTTFWAVAEILDNTTVSGTLYDLGDKNATRELMCKNNFPAPPGLDLAMHRNKIWMVGDPNYPGLLRSSDILNDGTLAPEAWPERNAYEMAQNPGSLLNLRVLNKQLVAKGEFGEWSIKVLDPTDYLQVVADRASPMGLLGKDAVVEFETTNVYPALGGFIETNGTEARFILPEVEPLIDSSIASAIGINTGLVSYFTYSSVPYGDRTAQIDLFRGKPRFANINDILFECLTYDSKTGIVYAVQGGVVYKLASGYANEATSSKELTGLITSRVYRPGINASWYRAELIHNTGGMWYRLEVYVDGTFKTSIPFKSVVRTKSDFRFGPYSGFDFQFKILTNYSALGTIYFPTRIYYGGK